MLSLKVIFLQDSTGFDMKTSQYSTKNNKDFQKILNKNRKKYYLKCGKNHIGKLGLFGKCKRYQYVLIRYYLKNIILA